MGVWDPGRKRGRSEAGGGRSEYTCSLEAGRRLGASLAAEGMERDGEKSGRHPVVVVLRSCSPDSCFGRRKVIFRF